MRTPQMIDPMTDSNEQDCDDIFGPPRSSYPSEYLPLKSRPSMISPKYKLKEERRKVLKISLNKLKKIDDPEASLCRSVLINNTMKRLQQETREEKTLKQQLNYPKCYSNDSYLNIKSEFLRNEKSFNEILPFAQENHDAIEDMEIENDFHSKLEEEIGNAHDSAINSSLNSFIPTEDLLSSRISAKKRNFEEMEECDDVQDVLSQFYMPPTPRMLTAMDEDEDVNVVDEDPLIKRLKLENQTSIADNKNTTDFSSHYTSSVTTFINNNLTLSRYSTGMSCVVESESTSLSCGHASMLGEHQSNVYHSLITSLET